MTPLSLIIAAGVMGHGSMYIPTPRNALESVLPGYQDGKSPTQSCTCTNGNPGGDSKTGCDQGLRGPAGQSCLWWSQGCSIGCKECATAIPGFDQFHGVAPQAGKLGFNTRYCNSSWNSEGAHVPMINATLPKKAWTLNIAAEEGSVEDAYKFNPWRAPGYAPVIDPCGQAGGKYKNQTIGGDSIYSTTPLATMGDMGSKLPKLPASFKQAKWVAGEYAEVAWGPLYNHGGGYQYRLCSAKEALTEECFQKTPLEFDRTKQTLVWNTKAVPGHDSSTPAIPAGAGSTLRFPVPEPIFVDEGTWPRKSTWARDPLPRIQDNLAGLANASSCPGPNGKSGPGCLSFKPPCPWDHGMLNCTGNGCHGTGMGACSADWVIGLVSDMVMIPKNLVPGEYVLSWRWDCEETAQIWANCADVTITA